MFNADSPLYKNHHIPPKNNQMLKQFDLFPKLKEENLRTTNEGGIISLIGIFIALLLIINETLEFIQPRKVEHLDLFDPIHTPGVPESISIHLEIEFFHLPCSLLTLGVTTATTTEDYSGNWEIKHREVNPTLTGGCTLNSRVELLKYESGEMHVALAPHSLEGSNGQEGFTIDEYFQFNTSHLLKVG
jgi:hypothetical protein